MKKLLLLATLVGLTACSGAATQSEPKLEKELATTEDSTMITVTGTIRFKSIEGGFYALDANDGAKYMPQGMDKSLLKNGMVVKVKGVVMKDMMTFQQYGEVLKVVESEMLDDSQVTGQNTH